MNTERIADLEVLLGHVFRDKDFILNALSHSSIKTDERPSNERLEFLGDSVLGLIISDALYRRFPDDDEGTLTRIKSAAVSRATLQRIAVAMGLDRYIFVGKGVAKREIPASLLGNLYEAIVGAIYLDAGLAASRKFILRHLDVVIDEIVEDRAERNYKSMLQHHSQRELGGVPSYRVHREGGPSHSRSFEVAVQVNGNEYGRARGASKKEAEQGAARAALLHFEVVEENPKEVVRGSGTVLRVGPDAKSAKKTRKKRSSRRKKGDEAPAAAEAAKSGEEKKPRTRRGRRGGRGGAAAKSAEEPAAAASEPAAPKKKSRRRSTKKKTAASGTSAAPAPKEGETASKKAPRRRRRRRSGSADKAAPPAE